MPSGSSLLCSGADPGPRGFLVPLLKWWPFTSTSPPGAVALCLGPGVGGFSNNIPEFCAHLSDSLILVFGHCFPSTFWILFSYAGTHLYSPCVALDFLLISPCCLDRHGLTHVLVLCFLCMVFRLSLSLT